MHFATWKYKYASDKEMYFMNGRASAIFPQKKKKREGNVFLQFICVLVILWSPYKSYS